MLRFHLTGQWLPEDVKSHAAPDTRRTLPEVDALIDAAWKSAGQRPGIHLFDGAMCRWESSKVDGQRLTLGFSQTSYRIFLGTNLSYPQLYDTHGPDVLANPVGLSVILLTHDGYLLMGQRSDSVAYHAGRVHPFAGTLEPADAGNVFHGIYRELQEELHLPASEVIDPSLIGIAEDTAIHQPELIFTAVASRTRDELTGTVDAAEHAGLWSLRAEPAAIENALRQPTDLTPIAIAALLLWSRVYIGDDFFATWSKSFVRQG